MQRQPRQRHTTVIEAKAGVYRIRKYSKEDAIVALAGSHGVEPIYFTPCPYNVRIVVMIGQKTGTPTSGQRERLLPRQKQQGPLPSLSPRDPSIISQVSINFDISVIIYLPYDNDE